MFVNSTDNIPGTGATAAGFKFRASPTDWDFSLGNQISTFNSANYLAANPASSFDGGGCTVQFTIENRPGEGLLLTTEGLPGSGTTTTRLAWGTFSSAVNATTQAASLNGVAPGTAFDTLTLDAQSRLSGSSLRLRNLAFTAPALTVSGDFTDAEIAADGSTSNTQHVVADTNLAAVAWTLSGEMCMKRDSNAPGSLRGDEQVRFLVTAKQGAVLRDSAPKLAGRLEAIPEPGAAILSTAALAGLCLRRRRNQRPGT